MWCVCMVCVRVGVCDACVERKGSVVSNFCYKHWSINVWILPLYMCVYGKTGTFMENNNL